MDSLTQIVLGAAVGEAVLGKKAGNRAMIWGAIGGTIPDLDVISNLFLGELDALSAHRGISHSIFFSVFAPFVFAWLISFLYRSGAYRSAGYKVLVSTVNVFVILLIVLGVYRATDGAPASIFAALVGAYLVFRLVKYYSLSSLRSVEGSFREWYLLFFLAFLTHIGLDCFTAYGTQVYLPFSNERVAFNTISVADPFYTVPFLLCVLVAAYLPGGSKSRAWINWIGIAVSSAYLLFTVFNRANIDQIFASALEAREIEVERQMVTPTLLQNVLWNCVAETDSAFYVGLYSMYDTDPNLHHLNVLKKDLQTTEVLSRFEEYDVLYWFSNGYLYVKPTDTTFQLFDLRYGSISDTITSTSDFVFRFELTPDGDQMSFRQIRDTPDDVSTIFKTLMERVKGY